MERDPFFSILIATFNRASALETCLASLADLTPVPGHDFEVLVLDNNSVDNTRAVTERIAVKFNGRLHYAFVARQGKAHALNHGIDIASGRMLCFTDDDALVDPGWLHAAAAGARAHPDACAFGGRVIARWAVPVPNWMAITGPYRLSKCAISGHDLGPEARVYKEDDPNMPFPVGVNLFLRREVFARYGTFRTDLWPGEDTELVLRIWRGGEKIVYLPGAVVVHPVERERLTKRYFRRWAHDKGRSMYRIDALHRSDSSNPRPGIPPYLVRQILGAAMRWAAAIGDPVRRFHHECRLWELWGQMQEARRPRG